MGAGYFSDTAFPVLKCKAQELLFPTKVLSPHALHLLLSKPRCQAPAQLNLLSKLLLAQGMFSFCQRVLPGSQKCLTRTISTAWNQPLSLWMLRRTILVSSWTGSHLFWPHPHLFCVGFWATLCRPPDFLLALYSRINHLGAICSVGDQIWVNCMKASAFTTVPLSPAHTFSGY